MLGKCPQTPPTAANSVRSWSVLFKISFKFPSIPFGLGNGLETVRPCPPRTWVLRGRASRSQFPFGSWGIRIVWQSLPALARLSEWCSTPTALLISASALGVCRSKVAALDSRLWHFPHLCDFGLPASRHWLSLMYLQKGEMPCSAGTSPIQAGNKKSTFVKSVLFKSVWPPRRIARN